MQLAGNVVLLMLIAFILGLHVLLCIPVASSLQGNILFVFSEPIEVKVGLLFENVLAGCTVTERKCLRIT